jgi:hypothetical protein
MGYGRSYIVGTVLIILAFVTLFVDFKISPLAVKSRQASWVLFLGGTAFVLVGWREQNKKPGNRNE